MSRLIIILLVALALIGVGFYAAMPMLQKEMGKRHAAETQAKVANVKADEGKAGQALNTQTQKSIDASKTQVEKDVDNIHEDTKYVPVPGQTRYVERDVPDRAFFGSVCGSPAYASTRDRYVDRCGPQGGNSATGKGTVRGGRSPAP